MAVRTIAPVALSVGSTVVTFEDGVLPTTTYIILGKFEYGGGVTWLIDDNYTLKTVSGFTVTVTEAGTFQASAIEYGTETIDASTNIVSLTTMKEYLKLVSDTSHDSFLTNWIGIVTGQIEDYSGLYIKQRTLASEIVSGNGRRILPLPKKPIVSLLAVPQVRDDGSDTWADLVTSTNECFLEGGRYGATKIGIYATSEVVFPYGENNVLLNCNAGFATVPQDFVGICIELVAEKFLESRHGNSRLGQTSFSNSAVGSNASTNFYQLFNQRHKAILDKWVALMTPNMARV